MNLKVSLPELVLSINNHVYMSPWLDNSIPPVQSLQPYGFIRNFYGNDLSITDYGNRLNCMEVGIIWKIFDMTNSSSSESSSGPAAKKKCQTGGKFKVS